MSVDFRKRGLGVLRVVVVVVVVVIVVSPFVRLTQWENEKGFFVAYRFGAALMIRPK